MIADTVKALLGSEYIYDSPEILGYRIHHRLNHPAFWPPQVLVVQPVLQWKVMQRWRGWHPLQRMAPELLE